MASTVPAPQTGQASLVNDLNTASEASGPHAKRKGFKKTNLHEDQPITAVLVQEPGSPNDPEVSRPSTTITANEHSMYEPIRYMRSLSRDSEHSAHSSTIAETQPPKSDTAAAFGIFSQILSQFIQEATDLVSLNMQKTAAKRELDNRDSEFQKGKPNHEKFPIMEEAQKRNKELAQKAYSTIEEKFVAKDGKLKSLTSQVATLILSSRLPRNDPGTHHLQKKVEKLEKTAQNLQDQLQNQLLSHQLYMEKQQTEREDSEKEKRSLRNELVSLRNSFDGFVSSIKPSFSEAQDNAAKCAIELETLKHRNARIEKNLAELTAELPENVEVLITALSSRVDRLFSTYDQKATPTSNNIKEESIGHAMSKSLIDHGQRILNLENKVKSDIAPLTTYIKSIVDDYRKLREAFDIAQSTIEVLIGRTTALESHDTATPLLELRHEFEEASSSLKAVNTRMSSLPSDADWADLREKIVRAENATSRVDKLSNEIDVLKKRAEAVEQQTRLSLDTHASAPVEPMSEMEHIVGTDEKVANMEKQDRFDRTSPSGLVNGQNLKLSLEAFENMEKRLRDTEELIKHSSSSAPAHMHSITTAPECDYDSLKGDVIAVVESMQSGSDAAMGGLIDDLDSKVKKVKEEVEKFSSIFAPKTSLANFDSRLDDFAKKVASLTQREQNTADAIKQVDGKYGQWITAHANSHVVFEKDLQERVDAVTLGIINIQKRLDLINTKDMALFILSQMESIYPNLRIADSTLEQHRISLQEVETRLAGIDYAIQGLQVRLPREEATIGGLRDNVNSLTTRVATAEKLVKEAKDTVDNLSKEIEAAIPKGFTDFQKELAEIKEWRDVQNKEAATFIPAVVATRRSTMSPAVDRAISISNTTPPTLGRGRLKLDSPAPRQFSGEPPAKTRRDNILAPPVAAKSNGVHRGPGRKRKRILGDGDDDVEDVDFEPNPPAISDDDD